jgi:hypothetical protein
MTPPWLALLVATAVRGAAASDAGPVTYRGANDLHLAPGLDDVDALAIHRHHDEPLLVVTVHLRDRAVSMTDLIALLGPPRHPPASPDAPGSELAWDAPSAWGLPSGTTVAAIVSAQHGVMQVSIARIAETTID